MDQTLLFNSMALLNIYVLKAKQRQQAGATVDEALLRETEVILRRLATVASIQEKLPVKTHP